MNLASHDKLSNKHSITIPRVTTSMFYLVNEPCPTPVCICRGPRDGDHNEVPCEHNSKIVIVNIHSHNIDIFLPIRFSVRLWHSCGKEMRGTRKYRHGKSSKATRRASSTFITAGLVQALRRQCKPRCPGVTRSTNVRGAQTVHTEIGSQFENSSRHREKEAALGRKCRYEAPSQRGALSIGVLQLSLDVLKSREDWDQIDLGTIKPNELLEPYDVHRYHSEYFQKERSELYFLYR
jgi:hypothetical protein